MSAVCVQEAIQKVIQAQNLVDAKVSDVEMNESGYVSSVNVVRVTSEDKAISLFIKSIPEGQDISDFVKNVFLLEAKFYDDIVGEFKHLEEEWNMEESVIPVPRCFFGSGEVLILQDLHDIGYKLWHDLKAPVDQNHVSVVMREYGKFHGLSLALKHHKPEVLAEISSKLGYLQLILEHYKPTDFIKTVAQKAVACLAEDEQRKADAFLNFVNVEVWGFLEGMAEDCANDVIVHGDCWTNNYMFKYEGTKVTEARLIDFQMATQGSPIIDLSYFFCSTACSKATFSSLQEHLHTYHESLSNILSRLGCDPETILPFEALSEQWKRYGKYGLLWSMIINKMLVADEDELAANKAEEILPSFNFISRNEEMYQRKMSDSISYFFDNDML